MGRLSSVAVIVPTSVEFSLTSVLDRLKFCGGQFEPASVIVQLLGAPVKISLAGLAVQ